MEWGKLSQYWYQEIPLEEITEKVSFGNWAAPGFWNTKQSRFTKTSGDKRTNRDPNFKTCWQRVLTTFLRASRL